MSWDIFSKSGIQYLLTKLKTIMMDKRDFVELTKAQYDALPDTKLTDGKYYFLTDVNALTGNIDDSVTTSTDTWSSSKINTTISNLDLDDLHDTSFSSVKNGDAPVYNSTTQKWENKEVVTQAMQRKLGATNLAPNDATTQVIGGVTFSIDKTNSDTNGIITLSGTSSEAITLVLGKFKVPIGSYVLSSKADGSKARVTVEAYSGTTWKGVLASTASSDDVTFNVDYSNYDTLWMSVRIDSGVNVSGVIVKPMVSVTAGEYAPYAPTNHDLAYVRDGWKKNGAYNLAPNDLISQVEAGITYQTLSDKTIQASGTASGASSIWITKNIKLKKGTYKICGTPSGGHYNNSYALYVTIGNTTIATDTENALGVSDIFTVTNEATLYNLAAVIRSGVTAPSAPFKPMITTDLNATYDDYVPHAKTNQELTDIDAFQEKEIRVANGYSQNNTGKLRFQKRNGVVTVVWTGGAPKVPVALTDYLIATIPSGYEPAYACKIASVNFNTFSDGVLLQFNTNGEIHMLGYLTSPDQLVNASITITYVTNS